MSGSTMNTCLARNRGVQMGHKADYPFVHCAATVKVSNLIITEGSQCGASSQSACSRVTIQF